MGGGKKRKKKKQESCYCFLTRVQVSVSRWPESNSTTVRNLSLWKASATEEERRRRTEATIDRLKSSCWSGATRASPESERVGCQLSGGGEEEEEDDGDGDVSSLRRRRRLSSAAFGSPSSPTPAAPSSSSSLLSVSEAAEVESAGCGEAAAAPSACSALEELEESFSWLGPSVLLPAAGGEAAPPVPLAAAAPASARGRASVVTVLR